MDIPVVDALFDIFGPFLVPVVLFAAGVVGYGVLLLAGRLLAPGETPEWPVGTAESDEDPDDTGRHEG